MSLSPVLTCLVIVSLLVLCERSVLLVLLFLCDEVYVKVHDGQCM